MKPILKPLLSWKTPLYYLFLLGLYNCSVIFLFQGLNMGSWHTKSKTKYGGQNDFCF